MRPPTGTLSADELEKLAITSQDLPGYKISKLAEADRVDTSGVSTSQRECRIQALVAAGAAPGKPAAVVQRKAVGKPTETEAMANHGPLTTTVTLASYSKKGWKKVYFDLGYSSTVCRIPFDLTQQGETAKAQSLPQDKEPREKASQGAGDGDGEDGSQPDSRHAAEDNWSQTLTRGKGASGRTYKTQVQRMGNTLIITSRTYPGAISPQSTSSGLSFPTTVATPQLKKFGWD
ncbi:hypothetical protein DSC45_18720 [Streptomyces sp. YIM 130001]|uniref:hypothetical protein n=1 Tax=Streptomyces sp. YIM 130001 TaxID=2259644 RepID=UPI000EEA7D55|nr:hypothetical protein [Streptomyces sp. YIM 130001]RII15340.1 hypothetical protein DSC45_18720 [Streptomyces sp. YIM 130001]